MTPAIAVDVIVAGDGVGGCLAAAELARAGRRVAVVGLTPGEGPPLGIVPAGPTFAYTSAIAHWGREAARELWSLHREAQVSLRRLAGGWRGDFAERASGGFLLARTRAEGLALAESEDLLREDGFAGEFVDGYMLEARFAVRGLFAGYWAEGESEMDGRRLVEAACDAARAAGATFHRAAAASAPVLRIDAEGARVEGGDRPLRAPVAVVATAAAVDLVPALSARAAAFGRRTRRVPAPAGASLPSPARALDGRFAWTLGRGTVTLDAFGAGDAQAVLAEHLPTLARPHETAPASSGGVSLDGLPLVGPVPGMPVVAAISAWPDLGWVPLLASWAVSSLLGGRDATPTLLRAARGASDML